jgi:hypothetical protein
MLREGRGKRVFRGKLSTSVWCGAGNRISLRNGNDGMRALVIAGAEVLNFVAEGALGGGVSRSLCLDNYGKSLSAAVLGFQLEIPDELRGYLRGLNR